LAHCASAVQLPAQAVPEHAYGSQFALVVSAQVPLPVQKDSASAAFVLASHVASRHDVAVVGN
jgi:hypothetical protein